MLIFCWQDEIESYNETLASTQPYTETGDDDVVIVGR